MDSVSDQRSERLTIAPLVMKWSVFVAAAGVVVYLCLLIVRPFFAVAAWSTVIAISCYPIHQRLVRRNGRGALSAAVTSTLMVLAVLVPLLFIGGVAVKQLLAVGDWLRQAFLDPDGMSRRVTEALAPLTQRLGLAPDAIGAWVSAHVGDWVAGAGQYTMSAAAGAGGAMLSFALIAVATFLFLRHGETLVGTIPDLLPFERKRSEARNKRIICAPNPRSSTISVDSSLSAIERLSKFMDPNRRPLRIDHERLAMQRGRRSAALHRSGRLRRGVRHRCRVRPSERSSCPSSDQP
jgi:AI-2E family transporter